MGAWFRGGRWKTDCGGGGLMVRRVFWITSETIYIY